MRRNIIALVSLLLALASFTPLSAEAEDASTPPMAAANTPALPPNWPPDFPQSMLDAVIVSEILAKTLEPLVGVIDRYGTHGLRVNQSFFNNIELTQTNATRMLQGLSYFEALPVAENFDAQRNHERLSENLLIIRHLLPELERLGFRLYQAGTT